MTCQNATQAKPPEMTKTPVETSGSGTANIIHLYGADALRAALPPQVSPELIEKLGKLANYLTAQGEYEACDLIDTVVERLTPKAKG